MHSHSCQHRSETWGIALNHSAALRHSIAAANGKPFFSSRSAARQYPTPGEACATPAPEALPHSSESWRFGDVSQVRDHIAACPAGILMRTLFRGQIRIDNVWQNSLKFCAGHCSSHLYQLAKRLPCAPLGAMHYQRRFHDRGAQCRASSFGTGESID